ncbi:MAG: hypothetical protein M4579_005702 [Chaenotheca gracillima]|nr:MAG: hypothetical protein M4579_005702 [Chaenotheca gracillima]
MLNIVALSALVALVPFTSAQASGSGKTTRYWDCCKPSCAWPGKGDVTSPVTTCDIDNNPLTDPNAASGCQGGNSYMCADQSPWAVSDDLAYGFAAVNIAGGTESGWCCACYELTFTSGAIAGKKMVVQATNTGGDLGSNQFDLAIPGGGVGLFNGCTQQYGAPANGWGAQYGGISDGSQCSTFAPAIKPGCDFRFNWFEGTDNPDVDFKQVTCPAALTAKSGCARSGETPTGPSSVGSAAAEAVSSAPPKKPTSASKVDTPKPASTSAAAPAPIKSSSAPSVPAKVVDQTPSSPSTPSAVAGSVESPEETTASPSTPNAVSSSVESPKETTSSTSSTAAAPPKSTPTDESSPAPAKPKDTKPVHHAPPPHKPVRPARRPHRTNRPHRAQEAHHQAEAPQKQEQEADADADDTCER